MAYKKEVNSTLKYFLKGILFVFNGKEYLIRLNDETSYGELEVVALQKSENITIL